MTNSLTKKLGLLGLAGASALALAGCSGPVRADSTPVDGNFDAPAPEVNAQEAANVSAQQMHRKMSDHEYHSEHQRRMEEQGHGQQANMGMNGQMPMAGCAQGQANCGAAGQMQPGMKPMGGMGMDKMGDMHEMEKMDAMKKGSMGSMNSMGPKQTDKPKDPPKPMQSMQHM